MNNEKKLLFQAGKDMYGLFIHTGTKRFLDIYEKIEGRYLVHGGDIQHLRVMETIISDSIARGDSYSRDEFYLRSMVSLKKVIGL